MLGFGLGVVLLLRLGLRLRLGIEFGVRASGLGVGFRAIFEGVGSVGGQG